MQLTYLVNYGSPVNLAMQAGTGTGSTALILVRTVSPICQLSLMPVHTVNAVLSHMHCTIVPANEPIATGHGIATAHKTVLSACITSQDHRHQSSVRCPRCDTPSCSIASCIDLTIWGAAAGNQYTASIPSSAFQAGDLVRWFVQVSPAKALQTLVLHGNVLSCNHVCCSGHCTGYPLDMPPV